MPIQRPVYLNPTTGELTRFAATDSMFEVDYVVALNANAAALVIGTPVYETAVSNSVDKADAGALATAKVLGLVADSPSIAIAGTGNVLTDGRLTATTAEWDAVTGGTGGLTPGSRYYLDPGTPGLLTLTVPTTDGQVVAPVMTARTTTEAEVSIGTRIVL